MVPGAASENLRMDDKMKLPGFYLRPAEQNLKGRAQELPFDSTPFKRLRLDGSKPERLVGMGSALRVCCQ